MRSIWRSRVPRRLGDLRLATDDVLVEAGDPVRDLRGLCPAAVDGAQPVEALLGPVEAPAGFVAVALLAPVGVGQISEGLRGVRPGVGQPGSKVVALCAELVEW